MAMALPNNAPGFGANFDPFNPFGADFSEHVPAEDSSWIGRLTFKVHDETLKHVSSEGARLIKKVTAYRDDGSEYWTQAFYRSTGINSSFPNIWFPFLGISKKDGRLYYSKDILLPKSWPREDNLQIDKSMTHVREKTVEFAERLIARSFLLGSNAISALNSESLTRNHLMELLFQRGLKEETVDPTISSIITKNDDFKTFADEYGSLKESTEKEINDYIGKDIYINYGRNSPINLSSFNELPNYNKNLRGGGSSRKRSSTRKRSSIKKRLTRRSRHRKGLNKKH